MVQDGDLVMAVLMTEILSEVEEEEIEVEETLLGKAMTVTLWIPRLVGDGIACIPFPMMAWIL